jgi:ZIP family zinc transporter
MLDAVAPILGALSTIVFTISDKALVLYLGFFAGFLLYIGASEILPEAHRKNSSYLTIGLTIFGAAFMYLVTQII